MELTKFQKNSQTLVIRRTQINPADYNPRKIEKSNRDMLKKNLKSRGLMGGIVWNQRSGNLVGGHQKLSIIDEAEGYPDKVQDYFIRVEVVDLSDKEEKEQNIFLNNKNAQGEWDTDLVKNLIPDIDYKAAGILDTDLNEMGIVLGEATNLDNLGGDMPPAESGTGPAAGKTKKDAKNQASLLLTFDSHHSKAEFLSRFGYKDTETSINGLEFNDKVDPVNL